MRQQAVVMRSERAVHDLGELAPQAAQGLSGRLVLGELSAVVLLAVPRVRTLTRRLEAV